jgi:hypothetical protein
MLIRIAFDITLSAPAPAPVILALMPRPEEMARISAGPLRIDSTRRPRGPREMPRDGEAPRVRSPTGSGTASATRARALSCRRGGTG